MAAVYQRGGTPKAWSTVAVDATGRVFRVGQRTNTVWFRNKGGVDLLISLRQN